MQNNITPFVAQCELVIRQPNIIIIPPKRTKAPIFHLNLSSNGTPVNIVSSAKYLGNMINNELNFHEQNKIVEGKVARSVGIRNKLKRNLLKTVMLQLYYIRYYIRCYCMI